MPASHASALHARGTTASGPLRERHEPEKTVLYRAVQRDLATFLAEVEADERKLPAFVPREFQRFLECGILAHGFARVFCSDCGRDEVVAFSCKTRGVW